MAKAKTKAATKVALTPAAALRQGWLAYLGLYGFAAERAQPKVEELVTKGKTFFGDLVVKGEAVEQRAQDVIADVRERSTTVYSAGVAKAKQFVPTAVAANDRVAELEAEVEALTARIEALSKKPARATKRAKAA